MTPRLRSLPVLLGPGFVDLAYAEWGPADGRPVVCAHGLTRNARDFDALAATLAKRGRRVVAVDFPGRGASDWLPDPALYASATYLAAMAALIARLDAPEIDWVGTSMGALMGMLLAAQPRTPVARLVMNDVGPFIPKSALERIGSYVGQAPRFASLDEVEAYLRVVLAPFGKLDDAQWRHLAVHGAVQDGAGWRMRYDPAIGTAFRATPVADVDLWPVWERVACPVLVLRGAESDLLLARTMAEMKSRGGAKVSCIEFADCGHAPALMSPDQIETVAGFLAAG
jgi:pimeloyl-ACP methyl ester carboxylesterase